VRERAFNLWMRSALVTGLPMTDSDILVSQPRSTDWKLLYHLAQKERPNEKGGLAWLKPLHQDEFRSSLWKTLTGIFSFSNTERLIVRDTASQEILAYLAIERSFVSRNRLILIRKSDSAPEYALALLGNALRRYHSSGFVLEHPHDDTVLSPLLNDLRFRPNRSIWHMRYSY
jgi:hypothetical protein